MQALKRTNFLTSDFFSWRQKTLKRRNVVVVEGVSQDFVVKIRTPTSYFFHRPDLLRWPQLPLCLSNSLTLSHAQSHTHTLTRTLSDTHIQPPLQTFMMFVFQLSGDFCRIWHHALANTHMLIWWRVGERQKMGGGGEMHPIRFKSKLQCVLQMLLEIIINEQILCQVLTSNFGEKFE